MSELCWCPLAVPVGRRIAAVQHGAGGHAFVAQHAVHPLRVLADLDHQLGALHRKERVRQLRSGDPGQIPAEGERSRIFTRNHLIPEAYFVMFKEVGAMFGSGPDRSVLQKAWPQDVVISCKQIKPSRRNREQIPEILRETTEDHEGLRAPADTRRLLRGLFGTGFGASTSMTTRPVACARVLPPKSAFLVARKRVSGSVRIIRY